MEMKKAGKVSVIALSNDDLIDEIMDLYWNLLHGSQLPDRWNVLFSEYRRRLSDRAINELLLLSEKGVFVAARASSE